MYEIKSYLYSFENKFGDMEEWEVKVAQLTPGLCKVSAYEWNQRFRIPWTIFNFTIDDEEEILLDSVKEMIDNHVNP